jgi:hypothetical protein
LTFTRCEPSRHREGAAVHPTARRVIARKVHDEMISFTRLRRRAKPLAPIAVLRRVAARDAEHALVASGDASRAAPPEAAMVRRVVAAVGVQHAHRPSAKQEEHWPSVQLFVESRSNCSRTCTRPRWRYTGCRRHRASRSRSSCSSPTWWCRSCPPTSRRRRRSSPACPGQRPHLFAVLGLGRAGSTGNRAKPTWNAATPARSNPSVTTSPLSPADALADIEKLSATLPLISAPARPPRAGF